MDVQDIVDATEARIRATLPRCPIYRESYAFWFPITRGSEYGFSIWCLGPEELSIDAYLSSSEPHSRDLDFWYHSFRPGDFETSDQMIEDFQSELLRLLTHETRILQRRRPRGYDFLCEVRLEDWAPVHEVTLSRKSAKALPAISSRERIYRAYPDPCWLGDTRRSAWAGEASA